MELGKIKKLIDVMEALREAKVVANGRDIKLSLSWVTEDTAKDIAKELQDTIRPIIARLEKEIRNELVKCGK